MLSSTMRSWWAASISAIALSSTTVSQADTPPEPEAAPEVRWYGGTIAAVDVTAAAVGGLGVGLFYAVSDHGDHRVEPLLLLTAPAILTLLVGGPIVHWARGRTAVGFASLALRMLPVVGSIIDIAFLSRETSEPPPKVRWTPIAGVDSHGFMSGFAVSF